MNANKGALGTLAEWLQEFLRWLWDFVCGHPEPSQKIQHVEQDSVLLGVLHEFASDFERRAISYRLFVEANRLSLPYEVKRALVAEFGESLSSPFLDLSQIFHSPAEFARSEEILASWLEGQGHPLEKGSSATTQMEEFLLVRARTKAAEVIKRFQSDLPRPG